MFRLFIFFLIPLFAHATDYNSLHNKYKTLLENTTWVVPPSTLLAYKYESGTVTAVTDQTVWIIDSYVGGYFFGTSYAYISPSSYSLRNFVGTITNEGAVYITFYATTPIALTDLINGIGSFTYEQGSYRFTMQMNSGSSSNEGTSHWSYMVSITPDSPYYSNLPGTGQSLPEFLTNF